MGANTRKNPEWWEENGGFFGSQYLRGDDSAEGYLPNKRETREERTQREVDGIIKVLDLETNPESPPHNKRPQILDCPCGNGRHTVELLKRGYNAYGKDINKEHLMIAEHSLGEMHAKKYRLPMPYHLPIFRGSTGRFRVNDIRHLTDSPESKLAQDHGYSSGLNSFDAVINMFYSFGFFELEEANQKVMEEFYKTLKSNGKLLIHTDVSPEMILQGGNYRFSERRNLTEGARLIIEEEYVPETKRIKGSWTILDSGENSKHLRPYSMRIYSAQEFEQMAFRAGFKSVNIYGSFNRERFTPDSSEMIILAKK